MNALQATLGELLLALAGLAVVLLAVILVLAEIDLILRLVRRLRRRTGASPSAFPRSREAEMSHPVPWIGLAAIVAMFVLPLLPARLFEGPRTIKRYPRRVICGDCGERWTEKHTCGFEVVESRPPLRAEVRRVSRVRALTRRSSRSLAIKRF